MKKEFLNKTTIGALLVIVGFFLPWLNLVLLNVSGFEMPNYYIRVSSFFEGFDNESPKTNYIGYFMYLFYLIPLVAGNILYCTYSETTKYITASKIILLIIFSILFMTLTLGIFKLGFDGFSMIGIGLYMTIAGCVLTAIDFIKQNGFNIAVGNNFIDTIKAVIFSRTFKVIGVFVAVFILFLISNPSHAKFEAKTLKLVDEHKFSHYVKYDDYLLFSIGKIKIADEYETVGFGCLFNVFITNEALR